MLSETSCASFTTALKAAERLKALGFANSNATKSEDKEVILEYVASTVGLDVAEQEITNFLSQALQSFIKQLDLLTAERLSRLCGEEGREREVVMQETF